MRPAEIVLQGTLMPDCTLEVDEKPTLPSGRVAIRMQPSETLPENEPLFDNSRAYGQRAPMQGRPRGVLRKYRHNAPKW